MLLKNSQHKLTDQGDGRACRVGFMIRARRNWDIVYNVNAKWVDIRPVAVRLWDDIGMVQFYRYWQAKTNEGKVITEYKRTEVFKNENGKWILLGGQGTPDSRADAAPNE